MINIDLSEKAQKAHWKSKTMSETKFSPKKIQEFFSDKIFSQQKCFFFQQKNFVLDWILSRTEFCLGLHTAVVFCMQSFNLVNYCNQSFQVKFKKNDYSGFHAFRLSRIIQFYECFYVKPCQAEVCCMFKVARKPNY